MLHLRLGFALACALVLWVSGASADLTTRPVNTWVTGPRTRSVVRAGDRLFVGGTFTAVHPASLATGFLATFDPGAESARPLPLISGGYYGISHLSDDGAGGWFAAGDFTRVGTTRLANPGPRLIRIRQDGTVQELAPAAVGAPYDGVAGLARAGDTLFAVFFKTYYLVGRQTTYFDLAPFDVGSGGRRGPIVSLGSGFRVIAADAGRAYVFGSFTEIAGMPRTNAAAFDAATLALTSWAPAAPLGIRAAHIADADVYVAGEFSQVAGASRTGLAAFAVADGSMLPWAPSAPCAVSAIATASDRVYLGGCVATAASAQGLLMAVDRTTGAPTGWSADVDGPVRSLAITGSTLYLGGHFTSVAGQSRLNTAAFTNEVLTNWNPRPSEPAAAVAATAEGVALGGAFSGLGAVPRPGVAEFDAGSGALMPWTPPLLARGQVNKLATDGRWLFVLGQLEGPAACLPLCGLLAIALDGSTMIPVPGYEWGTSAVATAPGRLYLGAFGGIIGFDTATGQQLPWRSPVPVVGPMLATGEYIYARPFGSESSAIVKVDAHTGRVLPWTSGDARFSVIGLATSGPWLLVGRVVPLGTDSVLVAVDQTTGAVVAEAPRSLVPVIDFTALGLPVSTGPVVTPRGILISSNATIIGIQPSGHRIPWSLPVDGSVSALLGDERGVVVAGNFFDVGGVVSPGLAILPERIPLAPTALAAEAAGGTVNLRWTKPDDGDPVEYRLEAGTVPGATDLGAWTLPPTPSYSAPAVPDGRYFVRVRAATGGGIGPPSNEVEVIVGTPPPSAPTGLTALVEGGAVTLTWSAAIGQVDRYVLDAGSNPGLSNLIRGAALGTTTSARFDNVPPGTYYARVRALNQTGSSPPSAEVLLVVGSSRIQRTR